MAHDSRVYCWFLQETLITVVTPASRMCRQRGRVDFNGSTLRVAIHAPHPTIRKECSDVKGEVPNAITIDWKVWQYETPEGYRDLW